MLELRPYDLDMIELRKQTTPEELKALLWLARNRVGVDELQLELDTLRTEFSKLEEAYAELEASNE